MRLCQPGPPALKRSTTSRVRRSETAIFVGFLCGPRTRRLFARAGNILANGFARRKSSAVHSGLSGSAAIPAAMRASSVSDGTRNLRLPLLIEFPFGATCRAQADHRNRLAAERGEHQGDKLVPEPADGPKTGAAASAAMAGKYESGLPVERLRGREIEPMRYDVGLALGLIPNDLHFYRICDLL